MERMPTSFRGVPHDAWHCGIGGKQETDTDFLYRLLDDFRIRIHLYPECFQQVRTAAVAGYGTVSVLGHRDPAARHHESRGRGDVERLRAVPAGSTGVHHRGSGNLDTMRPAPHGTGRPGQLLKGLPLGCKRRHEGADLGIGDRPGENLFHHIGHLRFTKIFFSDQFVQVFPKHRIASSIHDFPQTSTKLAEGSKFNPSLLPSPSLTISDNVPFCRAGSDPTATNRIFRHRAYGFGFLPIKKPLFSKNSAAVVSPPVS